MSRELPFDPSPKRIWFGGSIPGKKMAAGFHTHVLSDLPEDTDVFHVLTQDPPIPEFVGTPHFTYQVKADGTIQIKGKRRKK